MDDLTARPQQIQLESYLDESRVDGNVNLDMSNILERTLISLSILSDLVSTVTSKSIFSVVGRVIDQLRSALKLNIVESLACIRNWVYREHANLIPIVSYFNN